MCIFEQVKVTFGRTDPAELTRQFHEHKQGRGFLRESRYQLPGQAPIVTEQIGSLAVELDTASGSLTILDANFGVTLSASETLALTGFLSQHDALLMRFAYRMCEAQEMRDAAQRRNATTQCADGSWW